MNLPRAIDQSRDAFIQILGVITHKVIEKVLREWNIAKRWYEDCFEGDAEAPEGFSCQKGCDQPVQYGLPCAY